MHHVGAQLSFVQFSPTEEMREVVAAIEKNMQAMMPGA
jgi:hypothetical protein